MAAVVCLTTACQDEVITEGIVTLPAEIGEDILFGARAGFENANPSATRTAYNGSYTVGTTSYERIIWTDKDKIQIYSPQAHNPADGLTGDNVHSAHYTVVRNDDDKTVNNDEAYLERTEETSLQWGQGDDEVGTHDFYAMYPSPLLFQNADGSFPFSLECAEAISMNGTNIGGYIHTEQVATVTYANGKYTASPDMRYAYMVAKTTTTREEAYTEDADGNVKGVSLTFFPIVTAMELELSLPETSGTAATVNPVTIAKVVVKGTDIAGSFTSDISGTDCWNVDASGATTAFNGNITTGSIKADEITVWTTYGDNSHPLTLKPGERLTFTVFMKPNTDLQNIKVGIASDLVGQNVKYKTLGDSNSPVTIVARKKNVFTGLKLPIATTNAAIDYSDWMAQLPADTELKGISLPGTGNSFSYGLPRNTTDRSYYVSQNLTFDEQWETGIRAFEIVTDRANNTNGNGFADLVVQCGKSDIYEMGANGSVSTTNTLKVSEAVNMILEKLGDNPYETAMLIFTYQPEGNDIKRHGPAYMKQVVNYVNSLDSKKLVLFQPTLLLGEYPKKEDGTDDTTEPSNGARGKLMIIVRPNQSFEKDCSSIEDDADDATVNDSLNWKGITDVIGTGTDNAASYLLAINGCGTGKDKWGARGYKIKQVSTRNGVETIAYDGFAPDISNNASVYIESYMTSQGDPIFKTYDTNMANYEYTATSTSGSGNNRTTTTTTITRALRDNAETLNFGYKTNRTSVTCWFQEWARVIENPIYASGSQWGTSYKTQWFESYEEKLSNVKTTFDMAITGAYVEKGYVFINSLCGYLAKSSSPTSNTKSSDTPDVSVRPSFKNAWGGDYGNISALSTKLNQHFYEYVNAKRKEMVAPTGIVLMDFVSNDATNGGGAYWLPQIIIANNEFKPGVGDDDGEEDDDDNTEPDDNDTPVGGDQGGIEG